MKARLSFKKISVPTSLLVAMMQLEDKDAGQLTKAVACYVKDGKVPTFSNFLMEALFMLLRKQIDAQRDADEQRRIIKAQNAKRKVSKKRASQLGMI